jgi:glycosyltransferase involved in cell wall biosynthesis
MGDSLLESALAAPFDGTRAASPRPRIGVVVLAEDRPDLRETLDSVLRQGYPDLEVAVVADASVPKSDDAILAHGARLSYWGTTEGGRADALNRAVAHCSADLVAWLTQSESYREGALWTVARAYERFPGYGLYIGNGQIHDPTRAAYEPFCPWHLALDRKALDCGVDHVHRAATFFLRSAWERVAGLDRSLPQCLDWDLVRRISAGYAAVFINECLSITRLTASAPDEARARQHAIASAVSSHGLSGVAARSGSAAFPETVDARDRTYLPFVRDCGRPAAPGGELPRISIVMPSFNQAQFLPQALDSALGQHYADLELLVFDGGSSDGSKEILERYGSRLAYWVSEPDRGPAAAINKGFARSTGEVLGWLNSDDLLADGALDAVGRAFASDPELDMVYGNALYLDASNQLFLANHGTHHTALYRGQLQPWHRIPAYWTYVHAVPQPTVFFRRRLLAQCGALDESYHFIFDFELFWRFARVARAQKIERTQAFYRIHEASKTSSWDRFLVELYRFSRPRWPACHTPAFREYLGSYVRAFMGRRMGRGPHRARYWAVSVLVALSAFTGVGNPEAWALMQPFRRWIRGRAA